MATNRRGGALTTEGTWEERAQSLAADDPALPHPCGIEGPELAHSWKRRRTFIQLLFYSKFCMSRFKYKIVMAGSIGKIGRKWQIQPPLAGGWSTA